MFDLKQLLTTPTLHDGCNDQIVILIQDPEGSHGVMGNDSTSHTHTQNDGHSVLDEPGVFFFVMLIDEI